MAKRAIRGAKWGFGPALTLGTAARLTDFEITSNGSLAGMGKSGPLNPAFALWLMGYPTAWAHCAAQVTPLARKSGRRSSTPTSE